jgi:hypothetical protein
MSPCSLAQAATLTARETRGLEGRRNEATGYGARLDDGETTTEEVPFQRCAIDADAVQMRRRFATDVKSSDYPKRNPPRAIDYPGGTASRLQDWNRKAWAEVAIDLALVAPEVVCVGAA